nr:tyrosine-type recombinase/integrase [uncultured Mailhella sp.]
MSYVWEQRKLGEITTIIMGQSPKGANYTSNPNDHILIQGNADLTDGWLTPRVWTTEVTKKCTPKDIIFTVRAPVGDIGKTAYHAVLGRGVAAIKGNEFIYQQLKHLKNIGYWKSLSAGSTFESINSKELENTAFCVPSRTEQYKIGELFRHLDRLITLHQRKRILHSTGGRSMLSKVKATDLFYQYYARWIRVYKDGAVRNVTMKKYLMTQSWITKLAPDLRLCDITRATYQQLLNDYAVFHERQTTMDFHHQLKGAILDAIDEGLIVKDPTRKVIIKGKNPRDKKIKYLNQFELHKLLSSLNLHRGISWDWLILLVAKTGIRFSEALAITPKDFDFAHQTLSISKTWDYKGKGGFLPTKNISSVRKIQIDWQTVIQFSELVKNMSPAEPIFVLKEHMYNSTANSILARHCRNVGIPVISIHGLRHTHASLLLFAGVSIASVARRLGHSSMTTTQKTYLHIIHELENQDVDLVMRSISSLS